MSVLVAPDGADLGLVCLEGETEVGHRRVDGLSLRLDADGMVVRGPEPGALRLMPWRALRYLRFEYPATMSDGRPAVVLRVGTTGRELRFMVPCEDLPPPRAHAVASSLAALVARLHDAAAGHPSAPPLGAPGPAPAVPFPSLGSLVGAPAPPAPAVPAAPAASPAPMPPGPAVPPAPPIPPAAMPSAHPAPPVSPSGSPGPLPPPPVWDPTATARIPVVPAAPPPPGPGPAGAVMAPFIAAGVPGAPTGLVPLAPPPPPPPVPVAPTARPTGTVDPSRRRHARRRSSWRRLVVLVVIGAVLVAGWLVAGRRLVAHHGPAVTPPTVTHLPAPTPGHRSPTAGHPSPVPSRAPAPVTPSQLAGAEPGAHPG